MNRPLPATQTTLVTTHQPFVAATASVREISLRSVALGITLCAIFAAANTYLGLYAGMTVSASIPAAVLAMGILRGVFRNGTILESNIVQTIAGSGDALAGGIIFTVPALLIVGIWTDIHFWPTALICFSGGLLGICFMIPLRRSHIIEDKTLVYPEGKACAEVLIAGEKGGSGAKTILYSMVAGTIFKLLSAGITFFRGSVEWVFNLGKHPVYFGFDVSAALIGVGYIVGLNVAILAFLGGIIAWFVAIPIFNEPSASQTLLEWFWAVWSEKIRYLGVGGMIVGGVASMYRIRHGIAAGLREAIFGQKAKMNAPAPLRTDVNVRQRHLTMLLLATFTMLVALYMSLIDAAGLTALATAIVLALSFFFVAIGSYVCGLFGTSNMPVSGITIMALLATSALLVIFGFTGDKAILAALGVASVVCCAVSSAGDISQDLKIGHILGATPKLQQWMEVLGAAIPAVIVPPVLAVLHHAYGIGTGSPGALKAPQANLFANLAKGIFGNAQLPWSYVGMGAVLGLVILFGDWLLERREASFRMPVMAVAIGMYLPLTLSAPIALGGLVAAISKQDNGEASPGTLCASGLIAGEAIVGVILGFIMYLNKDALPIVMTSSSLASTIGVLAIAGLLLALDVSAGRRKE